jgi:hypothetical protein
MDMSKGRKTGARKKGTPNKRICRSYAFSGTDLTTMAVRRLRLEATKENSNGNQFLFFIAAKKNANLSDASFPRLNQYCREPPLFGPVLPYRRRSSRFVTNLQFCKRTRRVACASTAAPALVGCVVPMLVRLAAISSDGSARHRPSLAPPSFRLALDQKIAPPSRKARSCGQHS